MAEEDGTVPAGLTETATEDTSVVQHIPITVSDPSTALVDMTSIEAPQEQKMATVQLGDLSGHSVEDLAQHLPNIGIHFTCKKCNISCSQMNEVLAHFTDGKCNGPDPTGVSGLPAPPSKPTPGPTPGRRRGRPRKSDTPREPAFTVSKEAEYEELPRIAAPPSTLENPGGRRTRYSTGKIKRLDVLTLLGGRIKEEPIDDDDEYTPPPQSLSPIKSRKRMPDDSNDEHEEFMETARPRGRPKKIKLYENPSHISADDTVENMELSPTEDNIDGDYASVTIKTEGNAKVIVVNTKKADCSEGMEEVAGGASEEADQQSHELAQDDAERDSSRTEISQNDNCGETDEGQKIGDTVLSEEEEESDETSEVKKVTQRTVYSYTHNARKKRQKKCRICKQRFFHTAEELQIHTQCHANQKSERESYSCIATDCTYKTTFWNRMLDHIITHNEYRQRLRNAPFLRNIIGNFSCPICKKKFERKNNMKGHISKVHFKQDRKCDICGVTLQSVDEKTYKRHVEKCQNLLFQCSHCEYKTPVSANMRKHMKIHLGQGFTCDVCQAVFPSKQRFNVHRAIHEKTRQQFLCEVCNQAFMSQDALRKHVLRFHTEVASLFACTECSFTTKIQTDLKKHIASVHNKKFRCTQCPFQTNSPTAFEQHAEYHKPGRSFACAYPNCFYRGATGKQLSNHIGQVHKMASKHRCPVCCKLYKKKTHLARHLVVHTGDKPYVCLDCGMAFSSHSTYYRHRQRTGHDAKREGIVSVPQNISIQYVSQQDLAMAEEDGTQKLVQHLDGSEAIQIVPGNETVEYITQTTDDKLVVEDPSQNNQNIVILENENGEQVTYLLKMSEGDGGIATLVSEDGVEMDAGLAQQIHDQLVQLKETEQTEQFQVEEVAEASIEQETEVLPAPESEVQIMQGEVIEEETTTEDQQQVIYVQEKVDENTEILQEEGAALVEVSETVDPSSSHVEEVGPGETMQIQNQAGEDGETQTVLIVQEGAQEGDPEEAGNAHLENNWVQLTGEGLVPSEVIQVQEADNDQQEIQQVIYEESVVEVDNPDGQDPQYAIVLLPSSAACGDEPEAALSMLQLQSGSNMVISNQEAELLMQQQEQS